MIRIFSAVIIFLVVGTAFIYILGATEPVAFKGEISEHFNDRRQVIWDTLVDPKRIPQVKSDVRTVIIQEDNRGLIIWDEELGGGKIRRYKTVEKREPSKYVIELYDSSYGLKGTWTYFLQSDKSGIGTVVLVQEESNTNNTFLRGVNKLRGRDVYIRDALKSIRVGLFKNLLNTP